MPCTKVKEVEGGLPLASVVNSWEIGLVHDTATAVAPPLVEVFDVRSRPVEIDPLPSPGRWVLSCGVACGIL